MKKKNIFLKNKIFGWFKWHLFPQPEDKIESAYEMVIYVLLLFACFYFYKSFNKIEYREISVQAECLDDRFLKIPVKDNKVEHQTPKMIVRYNVPMTIVEKLVEKGGGKPNLLTIFGETHDIEDTLLLDLFAYTDSVRRNMSPSGCNEISKRIYQRTGIDSTYLSTTFFINQTNKFLKKDSVYYNLLDSLCNNHNVYVEGAQFYYNLEFKKTNIPAHINGPEKKGKSKYKINKDSLGFYRNYSNGEYIGTEGFIFGLSDNFDVGNGVNDEMGLTSIGAPYWFTMYDMSQAYYKINISSSSIDNVALYFDFVGLTRFSDMIPQPDSITRSGLIFKDPFKILKIKKDGLEFHAKFEELNNYQNVRLFLLSAIMSALSTIVLIFIVIASYKIISQIRIKPRKGDSKQCKIELTDKIEGQ